jgi:hypothetical protein
VRRAALLVLAAVLCACGATGGGGRRLPGLEERVPAEAWSRLLLVRESLRANDLDAARAELASVCRLVPDEPEPALLMQEVELRLLEQGAPLSALLPAGPDEAADPGAPAPESAAGAPDALGDVSAYCAREEAAAEREAGFNACLRAARVATDSARAEVWLTRAEIARPASAWVAYARAHRMWTLGRDQREARGELERALQLDAGLLPALRLRAALEAREGRAEDALVALESWLEPAREDPCVWPDELRAAELDRGALLILTGEPKDAQKHLERLIGLSSIERARRDLLLAAAHEARNQPIEALQAAQAAGMHTDAEPLALQQQALLYELWLQDLSAARAAWERVLAGASADGPGAPSAGAASVAAGLGGATDAGSGSGTGTKGGSGSSARGGNGSSAEDSGAALQALLLRVQARAHIERIDRELARRKAQAGAPTSR